MANSEFENVQYVSPKRPRRKFNKKLLLFLLIPVLILAAGGLGYLHYINKPLVTAPGQLEIYAYDLSVIPPIREYKNCVLLKPGEELPEEYSLFVNNSYRALPLSFSIFSEEFSDAAIMFKFSVDGAGFERWMGDGWWVTDWGRLGQQFRLENHQTIQWTMTSLPDVRESYSNITIYADGHIIGCATLLVYREDVPTEYGTAMRRYYPKLLGSVSFPKQDGHYQKVTEEDVQGYFEQWRDNKKTI